MLLLMTSAHPTHIKYRHPNLGRLAVPRDCARMDETHAAGIPWAADNGAFAGLDETAWLRMLESLRNVRGCIFATVPDEPGDAERTAALWIQWFRTVKDCGLPPAWVAQDGASPNDIPSEARAVFIGGSTEFKLSDNAKRIVAEAKVRGLWTHVGRVNTVRRLRYCQSIGADSVDGSKWPRWKDHYLAGALDFLAGGDQLGLEVGEAACQ